MQPRSGAAWSARTSWPTQHGSLVGAKVLGNDDILPRPRRCSRHTRKLSSSLRTPSPIMMAHKPPLSNGILDSRGRQTPLALVIEWGSESLRVVCPYCLGCHRHGLGRSPLTGQTRAAHCGLSSANYQLVPFRRAISSAVLLQNRQGKGPLRDGRRLVAQ